MSIERTPMPDWAHENEKADIRFEGPRFQQWKGIALTVPVLARALCVTSSHGNMRTDWPCEYHRKRALAAIRELARDGR